MNDAKPAIAKGQIWRKNDEPDRLFIIGTHQHAGLWSALSGNDLILIGEEKLHTEYSYVDAERPR